MNEDKAMNPFTQKNSQARFWKYALWLAFFTVFYNIIEGVISVFFGVSDEALTLFGFGVDSFIEVMSGIGILAMVIRIRQNPNAPRSRFEITALRVTGTAFYLLALGLGAGAVISLFTVHKPETTLPGVVISVISIAVMWLLVMGKRKVGRALNSVPILADANCTLVCIYMSVILLVSSMIHALTGFGFIDSIGALGLIYFSVKEGREAFGKANGIECDCEDEACKD
jgi:divalent metal cation (Fe/Co/Zn/Cd) transporter